MHDHICVTPQPTLMHKFIRYNSLIDKCCYCIMKQWRNCWMQCPARQNYNLGQNQLQKKLKKTLFWNSIFWKVVKCTFLVCKIEAFCKSDPLPCPHHSLLGGVRRRGTHFHVSTLSRGSGGWFYPKVLFVFVCLFFSFFFLQQFCPGL